MKIPKHMFGQEWPNGPLWIARMRRPFILSPGWSGLGFQCWPPDVRNFTEVSDHVRFNLIKELAQRWAAAALVRHYDSAHVFDETFHPPAFLMLQKADGAPGHFLWILEPHERRLWSIQPHELGVEITRVSDWGTDGFDHVDSDALAATRVLAYFREFQRRRALPPPSGD